MHNDEQAVDRTGVFRTNRRVTDLSAEQTLMPDAVNGNFEP